MLYFIPAQRSKQRLWEKIKIQKMWFTRYKRPAIKTTISWKYPFEQNSNIWLHLLQWVFMDGRGEGGPGRVVLVLGCAEIRQPIRVRETTFQPIGEENLSLPREERVFTSRPGFALVEERVFLPDVEQAFNSAEDRVIKHCKYWVVPGERIFKHCKYWVVPGERIFKHCKYWVVPGERIFKHGK